MVLSSKERQDTRRRSTKRPNSGTPERNCRSRMSNLRNTMARGVLVAILSVMLTPPKGLDAFGLGNGCPSYHHYSSTGTTRYRKEDSSQSLIHNSNYLLPSHRVFPTTSSSASPTRLLGLRSSTTTTFVTGNLWPLLLKFRVGPAKAKEILLEIVAITDWTDLLVLLLLAFGQWPLSRFQWWPRWKHKSDETEDSDPSRIKQSSQKPRIRKTFWRGVVWNREPWLQLCRSAAKVALSIYVVEVMCVTLEILQVLSASLAPTIAQVYEQVAMSVWGLQRVLQFKRRALSSFYKVPVDNMGRVELLDHLLDGVAFVLASLLVIDWWSLQVGMAVKGLVAFSSVSSLAVSLASKDLLAHILSGIALSASNKVVPGEWVEFGDGTRGKILKIGWVDTLIQGSDDSVVSIPNSQLDNQKISNKSRLSLSQVKQNLTFPNDSAGKIPALLKSIRQEIIKDCPKVITDGSRPFRVVWTGFSGSRLNVLVDAHFRIPPTSGDEYWENRQAVAMAIARAVRNHGLSFR